MNINKKIWDNYNELILSEDLSRIRKMLSRYELFKKTINVPGDILDCGVYKGVSYLFWLKCLKIFSHNANKKVVGFDMFSKVPKGLSIKEKTKWKNFITKSNYNGTDPSKISDLASKILPKNFHELIIGDIRRTSKNYIKKNLGFKISLLHLDLDSYSATKSALKNFFPVMSKGGIIILDEYGKRGWGESKAIDEFLNTKNYRVEVLDNTFSPTGFITIT